MNTNKYPSHCCQKCGESIGWLGRLLSPIFHNCEPAKAPEKAPEKTVTAPENIPTRCCRKCGLIKGLEVGFGLLKKGKDGYETACKRCRSDYNNAYYEKNSERIIANAKARKEKNNSVLVFKSERNHV